MWCEYGIVFEIKMFNRKQEIYKLSKFGENEDCQKFVVKIFYYFINFFLIICNQFKDCFIIWKYYVNVMVCVCVLIIVFQIRDLDWISSSSGELGQVF